MKTIHLTWREQIDHSARVNVPDDFDMDAVPYGVAKTMILDLAATDTYGDGFEYAFSATDEPDFDPGAPVLFEEEAE